MSAIYRYESYIKSLPPHYGKRFKKKKGKEQYIFKLTTKEIIELHIQYCRLAAIAEDYDYIVSFACGGIPLLDYISEAESWRLFGKEFPSTDSETKTLHRKLKLFPGLSWDTSKVPNGEDLFREWLNKVSANKKLLIIDCSLTGGAIAKILKVVSDSLGKGLLRKQSEIRIDGLIDRSKFDAKNLPHIGLLKIKCLNNSFQTIIVEPGFVESLLFEDFPELLGFDSVREDLHLKSLWSPGALVIEDEATQLSASVACNPFSASVRKWINNPVSCAIQSTWFDKPKIEGIVIVNMFLGLRQLVDNEYREISAVYRKDKDERAFLGKIEGIANKWKKDITSVNKLFSSTLATELSFLSHHLKKRQIVKGLIIPELVEFMEMGDLLMVTLNKSHIHENKKYSEFTFLIPVENLKSSQVEELDSVVPVCYKKRFDTVWPILTDRERKAINKAIKQQSKDRKKN